MTRDDVKDDRFLVDRLNLPVQPGCDTTELPAWCAELMGEAASAISSLEDEKVRLREAANQCRLAFAGHVSVQSAIDALDRSASEAMS